ncbi:lysophospholipid acyltransferase family protein [Marmoricola sp. RAF53]|uniref:lysophospholipid acyltransferase family protein n=1 Tax=Marmoricola sp. RAF53 TaxID=3233059 RepID=UPI003F9A72AF
MTASVNEAYAGLPRTDDVPHPRRFLLRRVRGAFAAFARHRWDVEVHGAEKVPADGPVIFAANHVGFLDGPLLAIVGPRPVHALTKSELFTGPLGAFLVASGQISLVRDQVDPQALRTALRVLRDGGAVGMFPESTRGAGDVEHAAGGVAYLALASGAPVVPTAFLGTRLAGSASTFAPAGSRLVMSYGDPIAVSRQDWPRRPAEVRDLTEQIRLALVATVRSAEQATGMRLPGPLPETAPEDSKEEQ